MDLSTGLTQRKQFLFHIYFTLFAQNITSVNTDHSTSFATHFYIIKI